MNQNNTSTGMPGAKKFIPGIAWFFLIAVLICLPGQDLPDVDDWLGRIYFDKWVHAGLFAVLALLFMWPFLGSDMPGLSKRQMALKITLSCCLWGLATEFIQKYFVPGRQFDWLDWSADTLGALLALAWAKWRFLR
ncbi:MAG: VanZ family protein [Chitinophagaceae bacterium]|nr:VanZ family protein [Chitinophagaceae bacterium]